MLKPIRYLVLYVVIVGLLVVVAKYAINDTQSVQAAPAEQITINTHDPQLKNIYLLGSVGDCDMYFVVVDISIAADHQQVITVCGADREAR